MTADSTLNSCELRACIEDDAFIATPVSTFAVMLKELTT